MKLYMHPVSTTCRPIRLFAAEAGIALEEQLVDIMTGEHHKEPFVAINPNRQIPVLEDGDLRLTESSAILKYIAEKSGSPAYPKDPKQRARVNEMMDWLNTGFYGSYGYGFVYPQIFPHHRRPTEEAQKVTVEWGKERSKAWLQVLNDHWIGPKNQYLCGDQITIADYLGACFVSIGEIIHCDLSAYPNVQRWMGNMKRLKSWPKVNEAFNGYVASTKDKSFITL